MRTEPAPGAARGSRSRCASDVANDRINVGGGNAATITATTPNIVQTAILTQNGATTNASGVVNADPALGALANNGGPTRTMFPGAGPAIDTGSNAAAAGLNSDQRGFLPRVFGSSIDLGAVEVGATTPAAPAFTSSGSTTFIAGTAGSFTVTPTGNPSVATVVRSGGLPSGVTFTDNGNGTATLSGVPAAGAGGTYTLTFTASNGRAPDAVQTFTLTIHESPTFTSAAGTTFTAGTAGFFTVTTTGIPGHLDRLVRRAAPGRHLRGQR